MDITSNSAMTFDPVRWAHAQRNADRQLRGLDPIPFGEKRAASTTIEAILYCVRERGIEALNESKNRARLADCNAADRVRINERIAKLRAVGRIREMENA